MPYQQSQVFVASLSYKMDEDDLRKFLSDLMIEGFTDVKIVKDRDTGDSKGFGFITFDTAAHRDAAIPEIDGQEFMGRRLAARESINRESGRRPDRTNGRRPNKDKQRRERPYRGNDY